MGGHIGATLIASLAKPALLNYCRDHEIEIYHHWNPGHGIQATVDGRQPAGLDLNLLIEVVQKVMGR